MKNLNGLVGSLKNSFNQVFPATLVGLGLVLMGTGVYITEEHSNEALALMGIGGTITSLGGGFLLGSIYEEKSKKNTYQTKSEDYQ